MQALPHIIKSAVLALARSHPIKVIVLILIICGFNGCRKTGDNINSPLIGTWQLIEYCAGTGAVDTTWHQPEQNTYITFTKNGLWIQKPDMGAPLTTFIITSDSTLTIKSELAETPVVYVLRVEDLQLTPQTCIEGCSSKYRRSN